MKTEIIIIKWILCEFIVQTEVKKQVAGCIERKCTYSATNAIQLDVMRLLLQIYVCLEPIMITRLIEMCSQNVAISLPSAARNVRQKIQTRKKRVKNLRY